MCTRVRQSGRGWHWALILTRHVGGGRLLADHGHTVVIPLAHTGRLGDALLKGVLPLVREAHPHGGGWKMALPRPVRFVARGGVKAGLVEDIISWVVVVVVVWWWW